MDRIVLAIALAVAGSVYPAPPGALNPSVTQATISTTICVNGWTKTVRPSSRYTTTLKKQQMVEAGYTVPDPRAMCMSRSNNTRCYEEDHLIPLELGGAPRDPENLWPEPWPHARKKDVQENRMRRAVCAGTMTLHEAQAAMMDSWGAGRRESPQHETQEENAAQTEQHENDRQERFRKEPNAP